MPSLYCSAPSSAATGWHRLLHYGRQPTARDIVIAPTPPTPPTLQLKELLEKLLDDDSDMKDLNLSAKETEREELMHRHSLRSASATPFDIPLGTRGPGYQDVSGVTSGLESPAGCMVFSLYSARSPGFAASLLHQTTSQITVYSMRHAADSSASALPFVLLLCQASLYSSPTCTLALRQCHHIPPTHPPHPPTPKQNQAVIMKSSKTDPQNPKLSSPPQN